MCLANLRSLATLCLALGGLPTTHQLLARSTLAIPLIPASGLESLATPFAQTDAAAKSTATSRTAPAAGMLKMSQGRSCSRRGRPSDSPKSLGHFSFWIPPPARSREPFLLTLAAFRSATQEAAKTTKTSSLTQTLPATRSRPTSLATPRRKKTRKETNQKSFSPRRRKDTASK